MMTVKNLIEALNNYPSDMPVLIQRDGKVGVVEAPSDPVPVSLDRNGEIVVEREDDTMRDVANTERALILS